MRTTFSVQKLNALKPADKPFEVHDAKVPGLLVRVQPSGTTSFIAQVGRGRRVTLGQYPATTLERARKLALEALNAASDGDSTAQIKALVRPDKDAPITLRAFLDDRYTDWLKEHRKSGAGEAARLRSAFSTFLDRPLRDFTAWNIEKWRTERLKAGKTAASVNRDMNTLRAALKRAATWGAADVTPLHDVKQMQIEDDGVVRYLDSEEEVALREALEARHARLIAGRESGNLWRQARGHEAKPQVRDHLRAMVLVSMNTGVRRGELLALTWQDIDLRGRMVTVRATTSKGKKTRKIPMSEEAHAVLAAWKPERASPDELVFPSRGGASFTTLKTAWAKLLKDAGIEAFRWHDLRHHFASRLVQAGISLTVVRDLLGHSSVEMTEKYAHLAPDNLVAAVAALTPATADKVSRQRA